MNVLVTGGAGYIGSHTAQKLLDAGHEVVVYDNLSTGFRNAVPLRAKFIEGDILDTFKLETILRALGIQAVIHFAAKLIVPESLSRPLEYYENNTMGVLSLAKACVTSKVKKIVFSSTAAVYGNFNAAELVSEDALAEPLNPYGWSKLKSEYLLRDCQNAYGLDAVCLRYFNVAGAAVDGGNGQRTLAATHLIKVASEAACGLRSEVGIYGRDYPTKDGTGVRDYIHVEDLADLHVLALDYLKIGGKFQIFNCGYGQGYSVLDVLQTMQKISGVCFKTKDLPRRVGDACSLVADNSKVKKYFSWSPKRNNLSLICESAFNWEQSQIRWPDQKKFSTKNRNVSPQAW
jgi:UDP-glucose 4-epimerase